MLAVSRNPPIKQPARFSSGAFLVFIDKMQSQFCGFMAECKFSGLHPFVLGFYFPVRNFNRLGAERESRQGSHCLQC